LAYPNANEEKNGRDINIWAQSQLSELTTNGQQRLFVQWAKAFAKFKSEFVVKPRTQNEGK
jgi:hypothetical protein